MWLNLVAGAFSLNTTNLPGLSVTHRLGLLESALAALESYRQKQMRIAPGPKWTNHDGRPCMLFVAPEYMFLNEWFKIRTLDDFRDNRFLESMERNRVVMELRKLSARYGKKLIFVPGSIASRQPIPRNDADARSELRLAKQRVREGAEFIQGGIMGLQHEDQQLQSPEAGPWGGVAPRTPAQKLQTLRGMKNRNAQGEECYLASNVAYMFWEGRIISQYAKRADYHEVMPLYNRDDTVYIPGVKSGRTTVGGINFGIEICLDHAAGVLRSAPWVTPDLPRVHLICSASVLTDPSKILVRNGGYVMHASTDPDSTVIFRCLNGIQPADKADEVSVGGGVLRMGVIELEMSGL